MKINKLCLYFLIILAGVIIPNVKASELLFGSGTAYVTIANGGTTYITTGDTTNNMPKVIYGLTANGDLNLGTLSLGLYNDYDMFPNGMNYSYLIFDTCLTGSINVVISNSSCTNSCVSTGTFKAVQVTGSSCTTGGSTGNRYYIQVPIQKWYYNSNAETYTAASYIHLTNNSSWAIPVTINNMFLSDEDFTVTYTNQAALIDKLNSVQTAITNMQNSINSNANTNTQNIINNQNTNAQQAHNDAVNTQNTIKDDSIDNPNSSINTIKNSLASNGVITSLVVLPVTLYQAILNSVTGTCASFSLGSLFGTNLTIPCINVANYLGTTLWGSIDVIISGFFIYMISRKMVKVFNQLSSLKEGDVLDG